MTAAGRPTLRYPPRRADTDWMAAAECVAYPSPHWTTEREPKQVIPQLRTICGRCEVAPACAKYALDERLGGGVYAGIYLPDGRGSNWADARHRLAKKTEPITSRDETTPQALPPQKGPKIGHRPATAAAPRISGRVQ